MSMPTIPDINPDINIDREDAINLIIASIAMEAHVKQKLKKFTEFSQNNAAHE